MLNFEETKSKLNDIYIENRSTPYFAHHADCYLQDGKLDFAIGILEDGIRTYPNDTIAHYLLGKAYFEKGENESARAELERAIKLSPFMLNAYRYLIEIAEKDSIPHLEKLYRDQLKDVAPFTSEFSDAAVVEPTSIDDADSSFEESMEEETAEIPETPAEAAELADSSELQAELAEISESSEESSVQTEENLEEKVDEAVSETGSEASFFDSIEPEELVEELLVDLGQGSEEAAETESVDESPEKEVSKAAKKAKASNSTPETISKSDFEGFDNIEMEVKSEDLVETEAEPAAPVKASLVDDDLLGAELDILSEEKKPAAEKPKAAVVSPTLGEIFLSQGKFAEAKDIFEQLLKADPDNAKLQRKLADIEKLINA